MECGGKMKMKSGGKWIQGAIKKPGSFTAQAKRAGMSVSAFRNKVLANKGDFSSTTVRRANLAKTLSKMRKGEDGLLSNLDPTSKVENQVAINNPRDVQWTPSNTPRTSPIVRGGTEKVAAYQRMLKAKGFNVDVDGAWGPKTQKAYEQYMASQKRTSTPIKKSSGDWYTPEQWDKATGTNSDGLPSVNLPSSSGIKKRQTISPSKTNLPTNTGSLPSVSLPTSSGIKRRMMMGGSIPGVNGSVVGPAVPMAKAGQSFPKRNAGTSKLSKYKKK